MRPYFETKYVFERINGELTGNGGLSMRDITKLHADVTMSKEWQILGLLGTTADAVYDQHGRWTTLIRNVEIPGGGGYVHNRKL
jgi:hypothetical protein